ncbi:hypothetical protein OZX73_00815 [Bifidobacterium sp. ESL0775]|uniref:hypothetical protein n=1 Tax=Bifidobacterium sp. ESL0775 TaxID=2983230 RepID=UPI0023F7FA7A|nr:hypothetical protein [Bifidobacterium sp. ESL0775]WEV69473.1 hypothetical protein OZX73_00815 [Bifidobacterium sp. ESL0775]
MTSSQTRKATMERLKEWARKGLITRNDIDTNPYLHDPYTDLTVSQQREVDRAVENAEKYESRMQVERRLSEGIPLATVFWQGGAGSGKTFGAKRLAAATGLYLYDSTPSHPLEGFRNEGILLLDEIGPQTLDFQTFLQLTDPANQHQTDGRYHKGGVVAPYVIEITTSSALSDLVYYTRGSESHQNAMDEVLRRLKCAVRVQGYVEDPSNPAAYLRHGYDLYRPEPIPEGRTKTWPVPSGVTIRNGDKTRQLTSRLDLAYQGSTESLETLTAVLIGDYLADNLPESCRHHSSQTPKLETDREEVMRGRALAHLTPLYGSGAATHMADDHHQTDPAQPYGWVDGCEDCDRFRTIHDGNTLI